MRTPLEVRQDLLVRLKTLEERIASSFDEIGSLCPGIFDNPVDVAMLYSVDRLSALWIEKLVVI